MNKSSIRESKCNKIGVSCFNKSKDSLENCLTDLET